MASGGTKLAGTGAQYFDGDPSNLNATLLSAVVVNLHAAWQFDERWQLFWLVTNLFENRDALYGTILTQAAQAPWSRRR
jgi:outer membrane receptor protein involved in Fe transport